MDVKMAAYLSSNAAATLAPVPVQQRQPSVDPTIDWQSASPSELVAAVRRVKQQGVLQGTMRRLGVSASQVPWLSRQLSAASTSYGCQGGRLPSLLAKSTDASPASAMQQEQLLLILRSIPIRRTPGRRTRSCRRRWQPCG